MERHNIGIHQFNIGDVVRVTGYDTPWNGHEFSIEAIKPHTEKDNGILVKMSEQDARKLWERIGEAQWWMAADAEGFDDIWWWEGFLTLVGVVNLENE